MILRCIGSSKEFPGTESASKCRSASVGRGELTNYSRYLMRWSCRLTATVLLLSSLAGCATTPRFSDKTLLTFLENGTTTKEMVFLKLGQPSGTFSGERIVTYKLGGDKEKGYLLLDRGVGWTDAKYNLVLIFDENNLLSKHSLVQVR